MKKGFTLIELLIVVIIIAILATFAIPQYLKAVERAKGSKARHNASIIASALKMCRAVADQYVTTAVTVAHTTACDNSNGVNFGNLGDYVEMTDVDTDTDWQYATTVTSSAGAADPDEFEIMAIRQTGPNNGEVIILDQAGRWDDDAAMLNPCAVGNGAGACFAP